MQRRGPRQYEISLFPCSLLHLCSHNCTRPLRRPGRIKSEKDWPVDMVVYGICCIESDGQREKAVCTMFSHSAKDCSPSLICRPQRRPVLCTIPIIAGSSVFLSLVLMQAKKQSLQGGAVFSTYRPTVHLTALRTRGCHGLSRGLQNEGRLCMDTEGHTQSHVLETGFSEPEEEKAPRSWLLAKNTGSMHEVDHPTGSDSAAAEGRAALQKQVGSLRVEDWKNLLVSFRSRKPRQACPSLRLANRFRQNPSCQQSA